MKSLAEQAMARVESSQQLTVKIENFERARAETEQALNRRLDGYANDIDYLKTEVNSSRAEVAFLTHR